MFAKFWCFIKELIGDNAYEKYLEHQQKSHPEAKPLSRKEFFKIETERKWSGIRRCC
jgi:uncharacterized short protein YbdD (DUF466 family)